MSSSLVACSGDRKPPWGEEAPGRCTGHILASTEAPALGSRGGGSAPAQPGLCALWPLLHLKPCSLPSLKWVSPLLLLTPTGICDEAPALEMNVLSRPGMQRCCQAKLVGPHVDVLGGVRQPSRQPACPGILGPCPPFSRPPDMVLVHAR